MEEMELIIKERRLRWLGHVLRMEDDRILKQAVYWQVDQQAKRKPGSPRNWIDVIRYDLKTLVWHRKMLNSLQPTAKTGVVVRPNVSTTRDDLSLSTSA